MTTPKMLDYAFKVLFKLSLTKRKEKIMEVSEKSAWKDVCKAAFSKGHYGNEKRFIDILNIIKRFENFDYEIIEILEGPKKIKGYNKSYYSPSITKKPQIKNFDVIEIPKVNFGSSKTTKIHSKESKAKNRDKTNEIIFRSCLSSIISYRRKIGCSERYCFTIAKKYTEKYNDAYKTKFDTYYSKPSGRYATEARLQNYKILINELKEKIL